MQFNFFQPIQSNGNLQGIIYLYGADDEEDGEGVQLFRSLIGDDALKQSTIVVSTEPVESVGDLNDILPGVLKSVLPRLTDSACFNLIEQFLEPSRAPMLCEYQREITDGKFVGSTTAGRFFEERLKDAKTTIECALGHIRGRLLSPPVPCSPRSSTPRRRDKVSGLMNELIQSRQRVDELQDAYATLESNCAEQMARLEELSSELHAENSSLRAELDSLKAALEELRPKSEQSQVDTRDCSVQVDPPPEEKATRCDLQAEVLSLKSQLAEAKLAEAKATKEIAGLSKELSAIKSPLAEAQNANDELTKKVGSLEKQAESKTKALETKSEEVNKVKIEVAKVGGQLKSTKDELEKAQRQLKEWAAGRTKLEEERSKAINISESMLRSNANLEKELGAAKAQVDAVKKQSQVEINRLQESMAEKESRIGEIARAAEVWAFASAEAGALKEELKLLQTCTDARQRETYAELFQVRAEYEQASKEWGLERTRLDASILSLTQTNDKTKNDLAKAIVQKGVESQGYIARIAELEQWGEQRWDAMGGDCLIA
ncbi:unnamed protein product [Rhizoctonia solani]|uniref:Uncharacterized protein n=1 Tax=Rhizoctonia solani TaxID=456999 RepID=A0A8H3GSS8_9AGAM|nr:unnamed protein product [Rhizoctonia solani]